MSGEGQALQKLLERAERQGELTYEDLVELAPRAAADPDLLERLATGLAQQGVEVLPMQSPQLPASPENPPPAPDLDLLPGEDSISLYLKEMSLTPLLTMEEEQRLAQRIERAGRARSELTQPDGRDVERRQDIEALIQDGRLAREALIKANTRLVVSVARRYLGRGVPFLDLIQEGNLGLMKAVERFEYQRGFRFSTYATWWIRQSIARAVADQGRTIRVPVHMVERLRQLQKARQVLEQSLGRAPSLPELAAYLEVDLARLRWMMQVAQTPVSLENPVGDDEETELGMYIEDVNSPSPAQAAYENMLRERVEQALATLTPREARVLRMRFGLGHDRPYTLEEVGQKFGLTRERIRQIEGKALRQLRQPGRARLLNEYR